LDFVGLLRVGGGEPVEKDLQAIALSVAGNSKTKHSPVLGCTAPHSQKFSQACSKGADGLDAGQGQPTALDRLQAKAALVLRPQADASAGVGGLDDGELLLQTRGAEGGEFFLFFDRGSCGRPSRWLRAGHMHSAVKVRAAVGDGVLTARPALQRQIAALALGLRQTRADGFPDIRGQADVALVGAASGPWSAQQALAPCPDIILQPSG